VSALKVISRTHDQRLAALARANAIRYRRAELKRDLKAGADPVPYIDDPPDWLLTMKVQKFLTALHRTGPLRAEAILRSCNISEAKTVGGMTARQRNVLAYVLSPQAPAGDGALGLGYLPPSPAHSGAPDASERHP